VTELIVTDLSVVASDIEIVKEASFSVKSGELVAVLGANGAGKSTLVQATLALQAARSGTVKLDGKLLHSMNTTQRAKLIAYLPQNRPLAWPNSVRDVVALGRFAYGVSPSKLSDKDAAAVDSAIVACNLRSLQTRRTDTLSGGELARVHAARALASQAPLLIADEPTAALDPRHQLIVMELIHRYVDSGGGALVVLHDVALAARFATELIWMKSGRIVARGTAQRTLTAAQMADVYGVRASVNGLSVELHSPL